MVEIKVNSVDYVQELGKGKLLLGKSLQVLPPATADVGRKDRNDNVYLLGGWQVQSRKGLQIHARGRERQGCHRKLAKQGQD